MAAQQTHAVARLHVTGIREGFLSSLGEALLADIYGAINTSSIGFVFVAENADGNVVGFVAGATSVGALYRSIMLKRGWRYVLRLARYVFSPRVVKRLIETAFYPAKTAIRYPDAELLSIVVHNDAQGTGVADDLLNALKKELNARGCREFKLIAGAELHRANRFYQKHGFKEVGTIDSHGRTANVMVYRFEVEDA